MNELASLLESLKAGRVKLDDNLPVFADHDWNNPSGVWSWDSTHMIAGTCSDDITIIRRPDRNEQNGETID